MNKEKNYIYPKLDASADLGFVRIGGSGLANCMFVAARAWVIKHQTNFEFIEPTWGKFSVGPYLRREKDKRHYFGLFKRLGISGLQKIVVLYTRKKCAFKPTKKNENGIIYTVTGLGNYFADLLDHHALVADYFDQIVKKKHLVQIKRHDFSRTIGVHIRLGDFPDDIRIDIDWYKKVILELQKNLNATFKVYIFSDGTDEELEPVTSLKHVERAFFGNALADIVALSRCQLIIGSHSTFSGWGAFLGQVPVIFSKRHFGNVLVNSENEIVLGDHHEIPLNFIDYLNKSK